MNHRFSGLLVASSLTVALVASAGTLPSVASPRIRSTSSAAAFPSSSADYDTVEFRKVMKDARDIAEVKDPGPINTFHNWGQIRDVDWRRCDYIYVSDGIRVKDFVTHDEKRPGTDRSAAVAHLRRGFDIIGR